MYISGLSHARGRGHACEKRLFSARSGVEGGWGAVGETGAGVDVSHIKYAINFNPFRNVKRVFEKIRTKF